MSKKLGGASFAYNAVSQDYCLEATVDCLAELCDEFVIVDAGSTDSTGELLQELKQKYSHMQLITFTTAEWLAQRGREKLSYFSNKAIEQLDTHMVIYVQADEVIHEDCFDNIRRLIKLDMPAYLCRRINLWGEPNLMLNVPHERKPCSTEVIRLATVEHRCVDDAESLGAQRLYVNGVDQIRIYHCGFIRDQKIHLDKIRHMQRDVFEIDYDKRVDGVERFDPWIYFDKEKDVIKIPETLPKFVLPWIKQRYPEAV